MKLDELFNKTYLVLNSDNSDIKKLLQHRSVINEQGIYGAISDSVANISQFNRLATEDNKEFISVGFPYRGLHKSFVLAILNKYKNYNIVTSFPKYDIENYNWENIRSFVASISNIAKEAYLVLDIKWLQSNEHIGRILSVTNSFSNIHIGLYWNSRLNDDMGNMKNCLKEICNTNLNSTMLLGQLPKFNDKSDYLAFFGELEKIGADYFGLWPHDIKVLTSN